jgi:hypothetical protein
MASSRPKNGREFIVSIREYSAVGTLADSTGPASGTTAALAAGLMHVISGRPEDKAFCAN